MPRVQRARWRTDAVNRSGKSSRVAMKSSRISRRAPLTTSRSTVAQAKWTRRPARRNLTPIS